jgi:hypothetical protein
LQPLALTAMQTAAMVRKTIVDMDALETKIA